MQRGRTRNSTVPAIVLACAHAMLHAQPDALVGPPEPTAAAAASGADLQANPGDQAGAALPVQESAPLGGTTPEPIGFRERFAPPAGERGGAPGPQQQPLRAGEGWWRTAASLGAVVVVILAVGAAARALARRSGGLMQALGPGGRAPSGLLQVLGRYPLGRGQMLVLLKLDRRVLLVSQSPGAKGAGMHTLCEITDPEEVASILMLTADSEGRSLTARFREMVSGFESSHESAERALAPVVVESSPREPLPRDALGSLRSRLDTLRAGEPGRTA